MRDPWRGYDEWKLRTPEDDEEMRNRKRKREEERDPDAERDAMIDRQWDREYDGPPDWEKGDDT